MHDQLIKSRIVLLYSDIYSNTNEHETEQQNKGVHARLRNGGIVVMNK
jgi:hypothetical protein